MSFEFQLLGIPIRIRWTFLLSSLLVWMGFGGQALGALSLPVTFAIVLQAFVSHELGHALAGRRYGMESDIELGFLMGRTRFHGTHRFTPLQNLFVSFAGPFVGIVLGGIAVVIAAALDRNGLWLQELAERSAPSGKTWMLATFIWVNLVWSLLNLIPILPLDGGNMMAAFFQLFHPKKGIRYARYASLLFAGLAMIPAVAAGATTAVMFLMMFGVMNFQTLRAERELDSSGVEVVRSIDDVRNLAHKALEDGNGEKVVYLAAVLLEHSRSASERDEALHLVAWGQLLLGMPGEARRALDGLSDEHRPDPTLAGAVASALGQHDDALSLFEEALQTRADAFTRKRYLDAVVKAHAFTRAGEFMRSHQDAFVIENAVDLAHKAYEASDVEGTDSLATLVIAERPSAQLYFALAWSNARSGNTQLSADWARKAVAADPAFAPRFEDADFAAMRAQSDWQSSEG